MMMFYFNYDVDVMIIYSIFFFCLNKKIDIKIPFYLFVLFWF